MTDDPQGRCTRRSYLKRHLAVVGTLAFAGTGGLISACTKGGGEAEGGGGAGEADQALSDLSCTDTSGLSQTELTTRKNSQYVDRSEVEGKKCNNCNFWQPPQTTGSCGGCQVVKGPIHPWGYCNLWAEKQGGGAAAG
jgi:hypothetical protein